MLTCEGYKMFRGTMRITPVTNEVSPFNVSGIWLYKPNYDCWYCSGRSYAAEVCAVIEDADGWIPVSERLPEIDKAVLVRAPENKNTFECCFDGKDWHYFGSCENMYQKITHWRPIPAPPKGE